MAPTLFFNGRFFALQRGDNGSAEFEECMLVEDGTIKYIGYYSDDAKQLATTKGAVIHDLGGKIVLPGFIDGHVHILLMGQSLRKLKLEACVNLEDIRNTIKAYAKQHPALPRIRCGGWMEFMTDGKAEASMLDDLDPRPIYIDSRDLHSCWCNSAAIKEMALETMPDPVGGKIYRNGKGEPTGLLSEAACVFLVWPHLVKMASPRERVEAVDDAIKALNAVGCTGFVEMAMDSILWEALETLREERGGQLPLHIAAHWFIKPTGSTEGDIAQVDTAIEMSRRFNMLTTPDFRIVGIKLMCDGVVDSCTAALLEPYTDTGSSPITVWTPEALGAVIRRADRAHLQCALHAIGDAAVKLAIDTLSQNGTPGLRHRIEHLELTSPGDGARLAAAGITASIQPAHADPALLKAWQSLLGKERCGRAFAYREFAEAGANLSIGSDSPTAPWEVLRNLYTATTRRSIRELDSAETMNPHFSLSLCQAFSAATYGSAYACFAEGWTGSLQKGLQANFLTIDMDWTPQSLIQARVCQTWYKGQKIFDAAKLAS
ncbi:amidohydrolase 3 [Tricladium varicosporioides]|nr:amidohydrolase 3 [Hymenoscyphus varicosporioides]